MHNTNPSQAMYISKLTKCPKFENQINHYRSVLKTTSREKEIYIEKICCHLFSLRGGVEIWLWTCIIIVWVKIKHG